MSKFASWINQLWVQLTGIVPWNLYAAVTNNTGLM